jgi:hypothetical protein
MGAVKKRPAAVVGADAHANTHKRVLTQKLFGSCLTRLEEHLQVKAERKTK